MRVAIGQLPGNPEFIAHGSFPDEGNYPMPKNPDTCAYSKTHQIFES
jgi:hypothetical protein